MRKIITTTLVIASITALSVVAVAFPFNKSWHESATGVAGTNRAGGGGLYGTGGRSDRGIRCSHCHIKGKGTIDFTLTPTPAFQTVAGEDAYKPGQAYSITVRMTGEHRNPGAPTNNKNFMALTIENASGVPTGRFQSDAGQDSNSCPAANPYPGGTGPVSPAGKTTFMYGDCHGVLSLDHPGLTSWTFSWIAPAAGAGDLTIHVGMVDGDTGGDSSLNDDAVERALPLREGT